MLFDHTATAQICEVIPDFQAELGTAGAIGIAKLSALSKLPG